MKELESLLLRIVKPSGNSQSGRFARTQSIASSLNQRMKDIDADRRARLLGGHIARRRARARATHAKGPQALAGLSDRAIQLRGSRNGHKFKARLRKDGTIRYRHRIFRSPTAAACEATNGPCNGWSFWRYRDERNRWVPLSKLRG
jgi:hypothetical protein